jgi:hypothetical protein
MLLVSALVLMMSVLGYCNYPGDCNGDMVVDDFDFNAVITNFGGAGPAGDSNGDGVVDDFDFNAVITNFGMDYHSYPDAALLGTWQAISALKDGVFITLQDALQPTVRGVIKITMDFNTGGTLTRKDYTGATTFTPTSGVWTAHTGTGTVQFGLDPTTPIAYVINGNIATISWIRDGNTYAVSWVKVVPLTEHDPALSKALKLTEVTVNNVIIPITDYYGISADQEVIHQFLADGTYVGRVINDEGRVDDSWTATWATGGNTFILTDSMGTTRGYYIGTMFFFVDDSGQTVSFTDTPFGASGSHDPTLVHIWRPFTATVDGIPTPLADVFHWEDPTITGMFLQFFADGCVSEKDFVTTSQIVRESFGTWSTSGSTLSMQFNEPQSATFSINGSQLTATMTNGGHTTVIIFYQMD